MPGATTPHWLFAISGSIPLLALLASPPQTTLLIYTLFVALVLLRKRLQVAALRPNSQVLVALGFSLLLSSLVSETLAWMNNYLARAKEPILFHPQLIPDLILAAGFYGGWSAAWMIVTPRFTFSFRELFGTTELTGIALMMVIA